MDEILPLLGYIASNIAAGILGFLGAALFCVARHSEMCTEIEDLNDELERLREQNRLLETQSPAQRETPSAKWGYSDGLVA